MVYLGRPSRGCQTCKARRIKCDETRPKCSNCVKTNRDCPGLPEEIDLVFRNENPGGRRKVKKDSSRKGPEVNIVELQSLVDEYEQEQTRLERSQDAPRTAADPQTFMILAQAAGGSHMELTFQTRLNPAIEQQATAFFFRNFVLTPRSKETTRGFLQVAYPLYQSTRRGSTLDLATQAVAISVIANWPGRRHLAELSQKLYTKALNAVQQDLKDRVKATSDETLLAVLLFSMYESITSSESSVQAWARHVEGAVTIVKARGLKQFENPRSSTLFRAVRSQMLTNAIQQKKAIPEFPGGWTGDMAGDESAVCTLLDCTVQLPTLLAKAKALFLKGHSSKTELEVQLLLQQALEVQHAFLNWEHRMPPQWGYKSVANVPVTKGIGDVETMETWPGVLHIYHDVHIACIRNNTRVSQMLCSSVVIDALKWLKPQKFHLDERYSLAKNRLQSLVDDICYSVPFHLYGPQVATKKRPLSGLRTAGEAIGGYFLIWPLYSAVHIQDVPDLQRRWLRGRLSTIARQYGLDQMSVMQALNKARSGASFNESLHFTENRRTSEPTFHSSRLAPAPDPRTSCKSEEPNRESTS